MLLCLRQFLLSVSLEAIAISPNIVCPLQNYGMHFPQSQNTMAPPLYCSAFSAKHVSYRHRSFSFWQLTSHFLHALVYQFHVLHFFAFLLLLDFVSLLLFVLVLAQSFSSQFLNLLAFLLLLSLESLYLSLLLPLRLLLGVLLLLFFSQHFLRLLSHFPELKPLLAPLLFSEPLFFPALYFPFPVYVLLHVHLPFQYISAQKLLCLSLAAQSALRAAVSASLILLYVIFQHFLLLLSHPVSVFPLSLLVHASLHVFLSPLQFSFFRLCLSSSCLIIIIICIIPSIVIDGLTNVGRGSNSTVCSGGFFTLAPPTAPSSSSSLELSSCLIICSASVFINSSRDRPSRPNSVKPALINRCRIRAVLILFACFCCSSVNCSILTCLLSKFSCLLCKFSCLSFT